MEVLTASKSIAFSLRSVEIIQFPFLVYCTFLSLFLHAKIYHCLVVCTDNFLTVYSRKKEERGEGVTLGMWTCSILFRNQFLSRSGCTIHNFRIFHVMQNQVKKPEGWYASPPYVECRAKQDRVFHSINRASFWSKIYWHYVFLNRCYLLYIIAW